MENFSFTKYEERLLHLLLTDLSILSEYYISIKPEIFSNIDYSWFFRTIIYYFTNFGTVLTEEMVAEKALMEGGSEKDIEHYKTLYTYLLTIEDTNKSQIQYLINQVERGYRFRQITSSISKSIDLYKQGNFEKAEDILISEVISLLKPGKIKIDRAEIVENFPERKALLESKITNPKLQVGLLTGIEPLDRITRGLWKGELGLIMGRTGIGKSFLALYFARTSYFNGLKVLYITEEMPKLQVCMRFDSSISGIEYRKFKYGEILPSEQDRWELRFKTDLDELYKMGARFYVSHIPVGCTLEVIRSEIEHIRISKGEKIDLLIVDDLDMMSFNKRLSEEQGQAENARGLKGIAGEYNIPIWFTTQLATVSYEKDRLATQDVGWSKRKVHVADEVIGLLRTDTDKETNRVSLQLVKYRDGMMNKLIQLTPDLSRSLINIESQEFLSNNNNEL
ncbi:MAG TPA: DnaB-like helicase C-terminal domain-containing protein [Candidatus Diapherotrites archaeon]|nr:DnaB-like helicase C-terminal domain-containing protein [Candidatus Diapherotrites archaeon]